MNNYTKTLHVEAIQINFDETIMNESKEIFGQHFSYYTGSVDYETGKAKGYYYINGVHCYNGYYVVKTGSEISVVPTDIFEANYTKVEDDSNYEKNRKLLKSAGSEFTREEGLEFIETQITTYEITATYKSGKKLNKYLQHRLNASREELFSAALSKFTNRQVKAMEILEIYNSKFETKYIFDEKQILEEALGENNDVSASSNDNE